MKFAKQILAAAAVVTLASAASAGVVIDDFNVNQATQFDDDSTGGLGKATEISGVATSILGGFRDIYITNLSGDGDELDIAAAGVSAGRLRVASGPGTTAVGIVRWDGDTILAANDMHGKTVANAIAAINQTGLAGHDLTVNSASAINLATSSDLSFTIEFQVFSGAGNMSSQIKSGAGAGTFWFSDFLVQSGTGADFSNVTAMQMIVNFGSLVDSLDLRVDIIQAVPEPGSIALAGLALLGLGLARRRNA